MLSSIDCQWGLYAAAGDVGDERPEAGLVHLRHDRRVRVRPQCARRPEVRPGRRGLRQSGDLGRHVVLGMGVGSG